MHRFNHTAHRELWDWLVQNPGQYKLSWPGWDSHGKVAYDACFACDYAIHTGPIGTDYCDRCPLVWRTGSCKTLFAKWMEYTESIVLHDTFTATAKEGGKKWLHNYLMDEQELAQRKRIVSKLATRIRDATVRDCVPCVQAYSMPVQYAVPYHTRRSV